MSYELRQAAPDEFLAYRGAFARAFGFDAGDAADAEAYRADFEFERSLAVFDGDDLVATAGIKSLELTTSGETAPMAGVTRVSVRADHRRRGLLTAMMRRQLDDIRDRGEAFAGLWASEAAIYGRYGYGQAAEVSRLTVTRGRAQFQSGPPPGGRARMVELGRAGEVVPGLWDRIRRRHPGAVSQRQAAWDIALRDLPASRHGGGPLQCVLYESDGGEPRGFALYRLRPEWGGGGPEHRLDLEHLAALDPAAYAGLWRLCLGVDLVSQLRARYRPVDEPLRLMLADSRAAATTIGDGLWLRLVDVRRALEARRYAAEGSIVFEVEDSFCDWNRGRYRLQAGPEGAVCRAERAAPADIALGAGDLATAYLGGTSFTRLVHAWRARELRPGAAERADRLFAVTPAPWCPINF